MLLASQSNPVLNTQWKILIVDDDEDDFLIVREMLKEATGRKIEVDWASTFEKGQTRLSHDHYNAVLVDYDLGMRSGIDLIRTANEQGYPNPLILFTGRGTYEVDIEAMQAGATLYLSKGEANPLLLERAIRYAIELKQKETTLRESEMQLRQSQEHMERELTERKRAEQSLQESEQHYRDLFEAMDEGFCTIEVIFDENNHPVDYRFIETNPAFERQTGIKDAVGRRMREIAPQHEERWFQIYGDIALTGEPVRFENPAEQLHHYYDVFAYRVGRPEEHKVAVLFNDISQRKQAEAVLQKNAEVLEQQVQERTKTLQEREAILHAFIAASAQVLYRMSPDWREMRELKGGSFLADTEKSNTHWLADYIHPEDQAWVWQVIQTAIQTESVFELEHRVLRADGSLGWTASRAVPVRSVAGEVIEWFGAASDITARKEAEAALQLAYAELDRHVQDRTAALAIANERLQAEKAALRASEARYRSLEERQTFLLKLSDALRSYADPIQIQVVATEILGEHIGATRVAYVEIDGDEYVIARDYVNGVPSMAGRYPVSSFGPGKLADYRAGKTRVVNDTQDDPHNSPSANTNFAAVSVKAGIGVPLVKEGVFVANLIVHMNEPRKWTPEEVALVEETAERTWAAVERAKVEETLRKSERVRQETNWGTR